MKIVYSTGARLAGGGIGDIACHGVGSLHRAAMLQVLLCGSRGPSDLPSERVRALGPASRALRRLAASDPSHRLWHLESLVYDAWAARALVPADLLVVWGGYGLRSMARARAMGMATVVVRASTHPAYQRRLLCEEYARWGLPYRVVEAAVRRAVQELDSADHALIPSAFVRCSFLGQGYPQERLLEVPFGADTARFRPAPERAPHPFRVLFIGQVGVRKGVPYLLEAWRRLRWADAELWLVGRQEGSSRPLLARWQGLSGVRWLAYSPHPAALMQQADVFAFPTVEEGSALVVYEALACGLPVVTTPHAGSVVRDGYEGFLVPIRDVDALAERLERLRADPDLRQAMGRAARERAEDFTWQRHGQALCRCLAGLQGGSGRGR